MQYIENQTTVVANNLSKRLLESYLSKEEFGIGNITHQTPRVSDWWQWVDSFIEHMSPQIGWLQKLTILSTQQEIMLWYEIISKDANEHIQDSELIDLYALAGRASRSRLHQKQWNILGKSDALNEDHFAFRRWNEAFENTCRQNKFIDVSSREPLVLKLITHHEIPVTALVFSNFSVFTPIQKQIITTLSEKIAINCICPVSPIRIKPSAQLFDTEEQEHQQILEFIFDDERRKKNDLIVISATGDHLKLEKIEKRLTQHISTNNLDPLNVCYSTSTPILDEAVCRHALTLLKAVIHRQLTLNDFLDILYSRWIKLDENFINEKIALEKTIREKGYLKIKYEHQSTIFPEAPSANEILRKRYFIELFGNNKPFNGKHSLIYWGEIFNNHLTSMNWPGDATHDTRLYSFVQKTRDVISRLTDSSINSTNISAHQALGILTNSLTSQTVPAIVDDVDVLLVDDDNLDYPQLISLWVCNADEKWIQTTTLDPFTPSYLQRFAEIPGAIPNTVHIEALGKLKKLHAQGVSINFSCLPDKDSGQFHPSSIISNLSDWQHSNSSIVITTENNEALEEFQDSSGLIFEGTNVQGGIRILSDFSDCHFKAYAKHRLFAEDVEKPLPGEDPRNRGTIVHSVLEKFWTTVKNSSSLKQNTPDQIQTHIRDLTFSSLKEIRHNNATGFGEQFDTLEAENLIEMICDLLELEKSRPDFIVEEAELKKTLELPISGLRFSFKIDRVDRLDNEILLIDYKTGKTDLPNWSDERLPQPQLPSYSLSMGNDVSGICFMVLHPTQTKISGISSQDLSIRGVRPISKVNAYKAFNNWEELNAAWTSALDTLALGYKNGSALVNPKDSNSCRYCEIKALCRISTQDDIDG